MRRYEGRILCSLLLLTLSALSLSFIPILRKQAEQSGSRIGIHILAGLFWGGLVLGLVMALAASLGFRACRRQAEANGLVASGGLPGLFRFRKSSWLLYLVLVVGLVCAGTDFSHHWVPESLMFPILSVTVVALILHCVLDGKDYQAYAKMKEGKFNGHS